jgi:O-antigen/teichoic acid export membrane protein
LNVIAESEGTTQPNITRTALRGAVALGLRQLFVQGSNVAAGIILARILEPAQFALWGIVMFVLSFLTTFGDAGLGASLIRQQQEPEEKDYRAIFTVQQLMVAVVVIVFWLLAPWLTQLYKFPPQDVWVFRFIVLSLLLTSFMVIPQIRLERQLAFDKLAIVEVAQAVIYNGSAIVFALTGLGELSFGIALLLRSLAGAVLAYWINPWRLGWLWDWPSVRAHLAFGLPFQGAKIVNLLKDLISPTFFVVYAGTTAVGYINWATMVMNYPLLAVLLLQRLYMPLFARLADDMDRFRQVLHKIVSLLALVVYTLSALVFVFRYEITMTVFGTQWLEALVLFLPFALISVILAPATVAMSALNALGHSRSVFWVTVALTVATWAIGATSVAKLGWQTWGWANLVVHLLYIWLLILVSRYTGFRWWKSLVVPTLIAAVSAVIAALCKSVMPWQVALSLGVLTAGASSYKLWWQTLRTFRSA